MSFILNIETSTTLCSVSISKNDELLALKQIDNGYTHAENLHLFINELLIQTNLTPTHLSAVAVSKGPGSYTGLRIGVSTAKGFCFALDKPLLAVNTLEAMAFQVKDFYDDTHLLCPMIDARRMEVYCQVLDNQMNVIAETEAKIIDELSFSELLSEKKIVFFGDGAAKCQAEITHKNAVFLNTEIHPSAKTVGLLATKSFEKSLFENVVTFEPFYLKDFVGTQKKL